MVLPAYEDPAEWIIKEGSLPENVDPSNSKLKDPEERSRIARVFERGLTADRLHPPRPGLERQGLRPPLGQREMEDPPRQDLPRSRRQPGRLPPAARHPALRAAGAAIPISTPPIPRSRAPLAEVFVRAAPHPDARLAPRQLAAPCPKPRARADDSGQTRVEQTVGEIGGAVRTAISVEPRDGRLCIFMPPVERIEDYLELIAAAENAAAELGLPSISKATRRRRTSASMSSASRPIPASSRSTSIPPPTGRIASTSPRRSTRKRARPASAPTSS
jgi:hypothetical protein